MDIWRITHAIIPKVLRVRGTVRHAGYGVKPGGCSGQVACKICLRDREIATDASVKIADILKAKIGASVAAGRCSETVADQLMSVLAHEFRGLDQGERE